VVIEYKYSKLRLYMSTKGRLAIQLSHGESIVKTLYLPTNPANHVRKVSLSFGEGRGEEKTFVFKKRISSELNPRLRKGQKKGV